MLKLIPTVVLVIRRSFVQHLLASVITILGIALATGLAMAVFSIQDQSRQAFTIGATGFDAVVGARGSQLQLVLNSIFHLETSPGNIPWDLYKALKEDSRVSLAIPYATGDNYRGFHIVGTTLDLFDKVLVHDKKMYAVEDGGRLFREDLREAVIGSFVAQRTGLKLGDIFNPYHGLTYDEKAKHEEEYVVVGVLRPTNTPTDRAIFIPIEGIFRMGGHVLRGSGKEYRPDVTQDIPDEHKEVSAVLLKLRSPQLGFSLFQTINRQGKEATMAWPIAAVMSDIFDKLGWVIQILGIVAWLVVGIAAMLILATIYTAMHERRREFAILRALGAGRGFLVSCILFQALALALLGCLAGFIVNAAILTLASVIVKAKVGVVLLIWQAHAAYVFVPATMLLMSVLAALIPALQVYKLDVSANLVAHS